MSQLRRVMKPGGISSHRVDLRDHLGGALNNLRFSRPVWESSLMRSSGFYTNRIRFSTMLGEFRRSGFDVDVLNVERWGELPTPRARIVEPFRSMNDEELRVRGFDVLLKPVALGR